MRFVSKEIRMARRKPRLVENVTITGLADRGKVVGRDEEGRVIFVTGPAPGDVVDILVIKKRKGVFQGVVKAYKKYSEDRAEPFCSHFGVCGGCKWQHIAYQNQVAHKQTIVENALKRIGKVEIGEFQPILGAEKTQYYRNKMEFSFSNRRWLTKEELDSGITNQAEVLGFHTPGTFDKVVDVEHCYLQGGASNDIRNFIRDLSKEMELAFFDIRGVEGDMRNVIIRTSVLGELMVTVAFFKDEKEKRETFLNRLSEKFPEITSLNYAINPKRNDTLMDIDIVNYKGREYIYESLGKVKYKVSPKSFFQTNPYQAKNLFDVVVDFAEFQGGENVYDLYTGTGSIACYVAKNCKQVVGIEEVAPAIEDAKYNAEINNIENTVFYVGDVKDILTDEFADKHGKPDILITDPPRAGMHQKVVDMLLKLEAPKVVYVSCNPATQARDLSLLSEKYDVAKVRPVDMFPHTHHIENVALLKLRKS